MVDPAACRRQIGVHDPHPCGVPATQRLEDGGDGVVTAAARPEPVTAGLEPGLPFGLQSVADPCLMAPIHEHRNAERTQLCTVTGLRYVHALDRAGLPGPG